MSKSIITAGGGAGGLAIKTGTDSYGHEGFYDMNGNLVTFNRPISLIYYSKVTSSPTTYTFTKDYADVICIAYTYDSDNNNDNSASISSGSG